ncbi:DUF2946 family protein [Falsiroseomonas sp.]|uniref:DUF2946 family protein n=1 Tax=Falsiroseomonas sp. TaxID=2870721 RepID=UPI003F6EA3C6
MFPLAARALRLIIALAFCLQSGLAMAHCARLAVPDQPGALQLVICTSDGLVTMDMSDTDQDGADKRPQAAADVCLACHLLPGADLPPPVEIPAPRLAHAEAPDLARSLALPPGARAPPYRPTGPPIQL